MQATALYLPALRGYQAISRVALIGYTALTIAAYFAVAQGHVDLFGLSDKACEVLLIVLLVIEGRRGRAAEAGAERLHAQVPSRHRPLVVLLGEHGADEADDGSPVGVHDVVKSSYRLDVGPDHLLVLHATAQDDSDLCSAYQRLPAGSVP